MQTKEPMLRNSKQKFLETVQSVSLSVNDMRAQGYDGACVMSGHVSGVQTRIRQVTQMLFMSIVDLTS